MKRAALLIAALAFLAATAQGAFPSSGDARAPERVSRTEAIDVADKDPKVLAVEREQGPLAATASVNDEDDRWEVAYFSAGEELVLV